MNNNRLVSDDRESRYWVLPVLLFLFFIFIALLGYSEWSEQYRISRETPKFSSPSDSIFIGGSWKYTITLKGDSTHDDTISYLQKKESQ